MRGLPVLAMAALALCRMAGAGEDTRSPYRPQARVEADPAAWYSPALFSPMPAPQPIHLCPECLKKFRWNIGFDVAGRYEALNKFYAAHGMAADAAWVEKRLAECRAAGAAR